MVQGGTEGSIKFVRQLRKVFLSESAKGTN